MTAIEPPHKPVSHEAELIKALQESIADLGVTGVSGQGVGNRFGVPDWELLPLQQFQYGDFRIELPATTVIVETESAGGVGNLVKYWPLLRSGALCKRLVILHVYMLGSNADYIAHRKLWSFLVGRMTDDLTVNGVSRPGRWDAQLVTYQKGEPPSESRRCCGRRYLNRKMRRPLSPMPRSLPGATHYKSDERCPPPSTPVLSASWLVVPAVAVPWLGPAGRLRQDRNVDVPAVVAAYDPGWPGLFRQLRDRVDAALAGVAHVTEHVGSTAVPGLDAKPIIDLDVVVPNDAAAGTLAAAGWQHQGNLGITGREAFLPPPDAVYHHLYAVVAGSQPHRDHIDLRDFLRTHPVQAARYGSLKHRLAALLQTDRSAYSNGKAEIITDLLRQARR